MGKRNKILAGLLALALFGPFGPSPAPTPALAAGVSGVGFAEETLTVSNTALSITSTLCVVRGRQTPALLEVLDNAIFFTLDSPSATPDSGDYAAAVGTVIAVERANYIRMIRQSVDTSVKVTCFRAGQLPTETSFDKSGAGIAAGGGTVLQASSIDDTDTHATGTTVVINMGAVAVPTDTAVSANDIGMVAMSLDRRALGDANIQVANGDVPGNVGVLTANVPRVTIAQDDEINDDIDTIRISNAAIETAVELIDNAVSGAGFNTTQLGGVTISMNTGVRDAGTQRVTVATDDLVPISAASLPLPSGAATEATLVTIDADTSALFGTVAGSEQQVDIVASLPAGTNNIGDVDAFGTDPAGAGSRAIPISAALSGLSYTAGHLGIPAHTVNNEDLSLIFATNLRYTLQATDDFGRNIAIVSHNANMTGATQVSKLEDVAHATADAGIAVWGVANVTNAARAANGDYTPQSTTTSGAGMVQLTVDTSVSSANRATHSEDTALGGGEGGVLGLVVRDDILAANASVTADGDMLPQRTDNFGATWAALTADDGTRIPANTTAGLKVDLGADNDVVVTNAGTFVVQEDGAALTALQLIDNAISGAGFNITQFGGAAVPIGAGLEATAVRVTLPTDGTGVVTATTRGANSNAKINCTANTFLNMTTATTTEIVAISASTDIYVCSYSLVTDGVVATNVTFVSGTGTNCATGQAARSSALPLTAATDTVGIARGSGEGMIIKSDAGGDALCVTSSGAAVLGVDISYAQF